MQMETEGKQELQHTMELTALCCWLKVHSAGLQTFTASTAVNQSTVPKPIFICSVACSCCFCGIVKTGNPRATDLTSIYKTWPWSCQSGYRMACDIEIGTCAGYGFFLSDTGTFSSFLQWERSSNKQVNINLKAQSKPDVKDNPVRSNQPKLIQKI